MKKEQLYFRNEDSELCYGLKQHLEEALEEGLETITLFEAHPDPDKDYFWCQSDSSVCFSNDNPCGKHCTDYEPKNGKFGICKHKSHCYTWGKKEKFNVQTGEKIPMEYRCEICGDLDKTPTKCTTAANCLNVPLVQEKSV